MVVPLQSLFCRAALAVECLLHWLFCRRCFYDVTDSAMVESDKQVIVNRAWPGLYGLFQK
jgi:hypothetical protein